MTAAARCPISWLSEDVALQLRSQTPQVCVSLNDLFSQRLPTASLLTTLTSHSSHAGLEVMRLRDKHIGKLLAI